MLIDADADLCWFMPIDFYWHWLILSNADWCWLVLIDDDHVGWCCLMQILIDAIEWHMLEHTHGPWTSIIVIVIVILGKSWILQPHCLSSSRSAFTVTSVPRHLLLQCWWFQFKIYASVIHYWHRLPQDFKKYSESNEEFKFLIYIYIETHFTNTEKKHPENQCDLEDGQIMSENLTNNVDLLPGPNQSEDEEGQCGRGEPAQLWSLPGANWRTKHLEKS